MKPIVSIGDLVADVVVSIPNLPVKAGQHQVATDLRLEPGGSANVLITGARLGFKMAAIGALGVDVWGQHVAAILAAEGVDLRGVTRDGTTTVVIVLAGPPGQHVFLGKYGHGRKIEVSPEAARLVEQAGAVYSAGYALNEDRLVEATLVLLRQAHRAGVPVYFDPGPQMAAAPVEVWRAVLPLVDVLLATEVELKALIEGGSVAQVLAAGPRTVVVKRGRTGCAIYTNSSPPLESPGYPVNVVDTSAAGDGFNAAFMVARQQGWALPDCARLANAVGAASVEKLGGGRSVPTPEEVQRILRRFNISVPEIL